MRLKNPSVRFKFVSIDKNFGHVHGYISNEKRSSVKIQNLKEKELNLEKAKTNLYLAAENQRHLQAV